MGILRRIFYSGLHYQLGRHPDGDFAVAFASVHLVMPILLLLLASAHALSGVFPEIDLVLRSEGFPLSAGVVFLILHQSFVWTYGSTRQLIVHYTEFKKDDRMINSSTKFAFFPAIVAVMLLIVSLTLF